MVDILGPASDHSLTVRPARTNARGSVATWFGDCSGPEAEDGTLHSADFYNDILAQLRSAVTSSGIVADNADDMLWRAMQSAGLRYAADSGTANHIVVTFAPPVTSLYAGLALLIKVAVNCTGATDITANGLATKNLKWPSLAALANLDIKAGAVVLVVYDGTQFQLLARMDNGAVPVNAGGLVRQAVDLAGSAAGGTKTASWTAAELIAETAIGGTTYRGSALTLAFNGAGTGAGGMDTGAVPATSDLHIYAIYNPTTTTWNTLGTVACSGPAYTGANMPAGFTASALLWSGKTDGGSNLLAFAQRGTVIDIVPVQIFYGVNAATLTSQSIAAAVPVNARTASGNLAVGSTGSCNPMVASTASGIGLQLGSGSAAFIGNYQPAMTFNEVMLLTPQALYWMSGSGSGPSNNLTVSRYSI